MVDKPEQTVTLTTYDTFSLYDRHARARIRGYTGNVSVAVRNPVEALPMTPVEPPLAKVTIFEVAHRPWGELMTSAEVGDCIYVGSREWRRRQGNAGSHLPNPGPQL
jgi:hypothetical protein